MNGKNFRSIVMLLFALLALAAGSSPALGGYTITDLGVGGEPRSINNAGQVTVNFSRYYQGYIYSEGVWTYLNKSEGGSIHAEGINDLGQVAGSSNIITPFWYYPLPHAYLYKDGVAVDIGPTWYNGVASDINNSGQIVGNFTLPDDPSSVHAFLYKDGILIDLGTLGGKNSQATAINSSGQVAGVSDAASSPQAFLYKDGVMTSLGTFAATDINDLGQVVGTGASASTVGNSHAILFSNGSMTDLGTLENASYRYSEARDINNLGQVVGMSETSSGPRAFLWQNDIMTDLNTHLEENSGWTLYNALAINDKGQIVGQGFLNGERELHGYLLTPDDLSKVDAAPPVSTIITPKNGDYIRGSVTTVTGSASDDSSGIANVEFSVDNGVHWSVVNGTTSWNYNWGVASDGIYTLISRATDNAGNVQTVLSGVTISVDNTSPDISITGIKEGASYIVGGVPAASYTVTDNLSGVASDKATLTGGNANGLGTFNYTVSATDKAGNSRTVYTNYFVKYNTGGFLAPMNLGKPFKLGSTIPVKFQIWDASGNFISTATATISLQKYSGLEPIGEPIDAISTSSADSGNLFRYSISDNQYIFNLNTKGLSVGTWQIRATLDDGTMQTALISLK